MHRSRAKRLALTTLALVLAVVWAFPVYWMLNSAFLDKITLTSTTPQFTPLGGSGDNFVAVIKDSGFLRALGVSLIVTLTTVVAVSYTHLTLPTKRIV